MIVLPNVVYKTIVPFAHVHLVILVIHSKIAIWNRCDMRHNVPAIMNVQRPRLVLINCVKIHVPNVIHASKMPNVEPYSIIQRVNVRQDGLVIHKFNATNVSNQYC